MPPNDPKLNYGAENRKRELAANLQMNERPPLTGISILQWLQIHFPNFKIRAFTLDADKSVCHRAAGNFVQQFSIDDGFDIVAGADGHIGVPFADGIFIWSAAQGDGCIGIFAERQMFFAFHAGHHK